MNRPFPSQRTQKPQLSYCSHPPEVVYVVLKTPHYTASLALIIHHRLIIMFSISCELIIQILGELCKHFMLHYPSSFTSGVNYSITAKFYSHTHCPFPITVHYTSPSVPMTHHHHSYAIIITGCWLIWWSYGTVLLVLLHSTKQIPVNRAFYRQVRETPSFDTTLLPRVDNYIKRPTI